MQVKKFEAPTVQEALKLVKSELGPEAIILSTKNNRKGFGLLSKASVEVTAAIAEKDLAKKKVTEKLIAPEVKDKIGKMTAAKQSEIFNKFSNYVSRRKDEKKSSLKASEFEKSTMRYVDIQDDSTSSIGGTAAYKSSASNSTSSGYARNSALPSQPITSQLDNVSNSLNKKPSQENAKFYSNPVETETDSFKNLQGEVSRLKEMLSEIKSESFNSLDQKMNEILSEEMQLEYQNLLSSGIERKFALALIRELSFSMHKSDSKNQDKVKENIALEMMKHLKVGSLLDGVTPRGSQHVLAMIGATGVGKTTTIAKLASQAILKHNLRVGLINLDFYKIAALDQLSTYAKILNVPFRQAKNLSELNRALTEFKPLDLILIDTGGYSQKDTTNLVQLKNMIVETPAINPVLILSCTTRDQELSDIVNRFRIFNPTGLIFSKLDESTTYGCIYNTARRTGITLNYFTVGQRVPEDIEDSTKERVVDLILDL